MLKHAALSSSNCGVNKTDDALGVVMVHDCLIFTHMLINLTVYFQHFQLPLFLHFEATVYTA